jgi:hypothetical protein
VAKKSNEFFPLLNNLFYKQNKEYDKKSFPAYLCSLWLSHDESLLDIIDDINDLHFILDDDIIYKYYYDMIPKGKRFIQWVKKEKSDEKEYENCRELGISRLEYRRYKNLIKKEKML